MVIQKIKSAHVKLREFKTLTVTAVIAVIFLFGNAVEPMRAQTAPSYGNASPPTDTSNMAEEQVNVVCQVEMQKFADVELGNFRTFITTNFQNKSSTGSLLETGISRYKEMRRSLYNKYFTYYPHQGALILTEGIEPGACEQIVQNTLSLARRELKMRAVQTSAVKKTTALVEKYKEINDALGTLNRTFLNMKAYLDTFTQKLPCYISKSCNKG
jgi:hypothetical protein